MEELLSDAAEWLLELRAQEFASEAINGELHNQDAKERIGELDSLIAKIKKQVDVPTAA